MGLCATKDNPTAFFPNSLSSSQKNDFKKTKKRRISRIPTKIMVEFETDIEKSDIELSPTEIKSKRSRRISSIIMKNQEKFNRGFESSFYT